VTGGLGAAPPSLPKMSPIDTAPSCAPGMPGMSNSGMPPPPPAPRSRFPCRRVRRSQLARKLSLVAALEFADQGIDHAILGGLLGARLHVLALALAVRPIATSTRSAHDLLDVAPDIADFGEFGGLDLEERRAASLARRRKSRSCRRRSARSSGCSSAAPPRAACRRAAGGASGCAARWRPALGVVLADDVAVEFGDDFAGREVGHLF